MKEDTNACKPCTSESTMNLKNLQQIKGEPKCSQFNPIKCFPTRLGSNLQCALGSYNKYNCAT
eukprot:9341325-Ditylum_brightwellii.AAC.1